jgi:hypothetical protein
MKGTGFRNTPPQRDVKLLNKLLLAQRQGCFYCGCHISLRKYFSSLRYATVDHFIPLNHGGRDHISNVVLACGSCNQRKGSRLPTLAEIVKWNSLAWIWLHIRPLNLEAYAPQKQCISCGVPIPIARQLRAIESECETKVCSAVCSASEKRKRRELRRQSTALEGTVADAEEKA